MQTQPPHDRCDFTIALICALSLEAECVLGAFDMFWEDDGKKFDQVSGDPNAYTTGVIGNHNVVLVYLPGMGTNSAAAVVGSLRVSFPSIKLAIAVGICGGMPYGTDQKEILLGDVVISEALVQYDFGRQYPSGFQRKNLVQDILGRPSPEIRAIQAKLRTHRYKHRMQDNLAMYLEEIQQKISQTKYPGRESDILYISSHIHRHHSSAACDVCGMDDHICELALYTECEDLGCESSMQIRCRLSMEESTTQPAVHFGLVGSGNTVIKSGQHRDQVAQIDGIIAFEMEGAGVWDHIPSIVIKGVCDYADSHKRKGWQRYAAATAAACTKAFLVEWSSEHSEFPRNRTLLIPFRRDPDFVDRGIDRGSLLNQIHQRCSVPGSRTALVGLGGVGKSQLAIEYSYQISEHSPTRWIFWIHASNAARFEQSFRAIADRVQIPERKSSRANIFKLVHDWLCDERQGHWILVLDNIDDAAFLHLNPSTHENPGSVSKSQSSFRLLDYIPPSLHGSILITSRSKGAVLDLVEERDIIQVSPMEETDAITLLRKKLGDQADRQELAVLAYELEFMPLALVQAAAYISQRAPRCPVSKYIKKFQNSDKGKTTLLNHEGGHLRRDREARNSVIITWQISFDHIRDTRPSAADLLSLMSFFDRQEIPETLLRNRDLIDSTRNRGQRSLRNVGENEKDDEDEKIENISVNDESVADSDEEEELNEDILYLRNYSFISINIDTATFEMHGLIQLAVQGWLVAQGRLERYQQQHIRNLYTHFPTGEHENWIKCQALFPHVRAALSRQPNKESSNLEWAALLYHGAWYAWQTGQVTEANTLASKSMKVRKKILGTEHKDTLKNIAMLGLTFNLGGRWKEAEELFVQVMETSLKVFGSEHPDTLMSIANLALTYRNQGRWKEAEELFLQVTERRKRVLGREHPETLASIANLALTYRKQGRWKEAEELFMQVIDMRKRVLGKEHPSTLTSIANLSSTYRCQGRWKEAEELEVQVIEMRKRVLGDKHPDTLISVANLASTFRYQGRWKEAEELFIQVKKIRWRVLGSEHPSTLISMANIALIYQKQGRWKEAEELFLQVTETRKRVLGSEHPDTLTSIANLASTYRYEGRWKEAEELGVQVMETRKRVLGSQHPETLDSMNNLAQTWRRQGRYIDAIELMEEYVRQGLRVIGANHPHISSSSQVLANWKAEDAS